LRVKDQQRRWGSASAKGALNFNWRLVLAPPPVLDYVVVHELCHLLELNHSPRFWARVAAVLPDFRERQAWLREHGPALYDL
jgi:predicted metal-dependent hydrolase